MSSHYREAEPEHKDPVNPIWRGIGCLLMIIIPIMSFAVSILLYQAHIPQEYFPLTRDLANMTYIPVFNETIPLYYILVVTALVTFLGYIALTVVYSLMFRASGGSRYGALDADPREFKKRKTKKSR
ncbi:MAG TPA: hypothetical protein PK530_07400 [Anaerolineales bacterium]|nr:hypothetical protein [Anaerolineales bacterium]